MDKDNEKKDESDFLNQKLSRREFIKKSVIGLGALAIGAYTIKGLMLNPSFSRDHTLKNEPLKSTWKFTREAQFYTKLNNKEVRCELCPHQCYLADKDRGFCRARVNKEGKLYTTSYGCPASIHIDPIEKKPFYQFLPGTKAFSLSTGGCNLRCLYCQNWELSQNKPEDLNVADLPPEKTVAAVLASKQQDSSVKSIAYTYGEPVAFYDYMVDTAKLAKQNGIKNTVITAGYLLEKPMNRLTNRVHAIKIDLKGFNNNFYRNVCSAELEPVLKATKQAAQKTWVEIVNLVVPTLNDNLEELKQLSEWVKSVNKDIPIHFSRFHPQYKLTNLPPTPMETLKKAREQALDVGLNYVYIGNVPHGDYENTYCPKCKKIAIERHGYIIKQNNIKNGRCTACNEPITGVYA